MLAKLKQKLFLNSFPVGPMISLHGHVALWELFADGVLCNFIQLTSFFLHLKSLALQRISSRCEFLTNIGFSFAWFLDHRLVFNQYPGTFV